MRRLVPLLLVTLPILTGAEEAPFAPEQRARRDPFRVELEPFAYRVLHPGREHHCCYWHQGYHLREKLVRLEQEGLFNEDYRQVVGHLVPRILGYVPWHQVRLHNIRSQALLRRAMIERQLMLANGWDEVPAAVRQRYLVAADHGSLPDLQGLAEDPGHPKPDFVLASLARAQLEAGKLAEAQATLGKLETRFPDSPKADEAAYLRAAGPAICDQVHDPLATDQVLAAYLETHPAGRWRGPATSWRACLRVKWPDKAWPEPDALAAAARLYEGLLLEEACAGVFLDAVASLRIVWPRLALADGPQDPRLAVIYAHHLVTNRDEKAAAAVDRAVDLLKDPAAADVVLRGNLVQLLVQADRRHEAAGVLRTIPEDAGVFARYLHGRLAASRDDVDGATRIFARLEALGATDEAALWYASDLGSRIGVALERAGRWEEALEQYRLVGDQWNAELCTRGEMPLDALIAWKAAHPRWDRPARGERQVKEQEDPFALQLCQRLLAADRIEEAAALKVEQLRDRLPKLLALHRQAQAGQPADLYALAAYWYHHGSSLMNDGDPWGRWHFWTWPKPELQGDGVDPALIERWAERQDDYARANGRMKALPLFARVARDAQEPELAAKALYSAGLCCWWLRGRNKQSHRGSYWAWRDREGEFSTLGDAFMMDLVARFPQHPLAKSRHAVAASRRLGSGKL